MLTSKPKNSFFLVLPLALMLAATAHAQQAIDQTLATKADELEQRSMERQEIREEMLKIRAEHEELDDECDQIKIHCLNAKGQDHSECRKKWNSLHQRQEALHERMKNLHEKILAAREEYRSATSQHSSAATREAPLLDERDIVTGNAVELPSAREAPEAK